MSNSSQPELSKPTVGQIQPLQLTSPLLHIGSSVSQLSPFEYVQTDHTIYLPNQDALARALYQNRHLEAYIEAINSNSEITELLGSNWLELTDAKGQPIFPHHQRITKWTDQTIHNLRPMIRNGFGEHYVPGSSIKGAMRTAIAYYLLKHADEYNLPTSVRVSEVESKLRRKLDNRELQSRYKQKQADDRLFMDTLFSGFVLQTEKRKFPVKSKPNRDFMRAVQVTDTQPLYFDADASINIPIANQVTVSSHTAAGEAKSRHSPFVEMIHRVQAQFTLSLDTEMLSWFQHENGMQLPFQSVDKLLNICRTFAQAQWEAEQAYWNKIQDRVDGETNLDFSLIREFYQPAQCPFDLRLGWASGMTGTTVWACGSPEDRLFPEDLRAKIRDVCGKSREEFDAPKSRRTVRNAEGNLEYALGWVNFTELERT